MRLGYRIRPAYRLRGKVHPQNVCWCRSGVVQCEPSRENEEENDAREQVDRDDAREQVDRDDAHKRADDAEQAGGAGDGLVAAKVETWRIDVPWVPTREEVELFGHRSSDEESVETLILGEAGNKMGVEESVETVILGETGNKMGVEESVETVILGEADNAMGVEAQDLRSRVKRWRWRVLDHSMCSCRASLESWVHRYQLQVSVDARCASFLTPLPRGTCCLPHITCTATACLRGCVERWRAR